MGKPAAKLRCDAGQRKRTGSLGFSKPKGVAGDVVYGVGERRGVIRFSDFPARDLDSTLGKEWLETNGIGGFASSTIPGLNTRRYHGLLVAATKPPLGRCVLLSKLEETVICGESRIALSANEYPGAIHPAGHLYLQEFRLDPFPIFVYRVRDLTVQKRVFAVHRENTTVVEYEASGPCVIEIRPLIAFRDYHSLTHFNDALNGEVQISPGCVRIAPYPGLPALHFAHNASDVQKTGEWYYKFHYRVEQERGLDYEEDLFNPFVMRFELAGTLSAAVIASTELHEARDAATFREREVARRRHGLLEAAADQFIVKRGDLETILAGYHWFSDWGRDTMVALPGLTLVTGRIETAKKILLAYAGMISEGMLPNRWPDAGDEPEYNTVDATLWFFEAIGAFVRHTNDFAFLRSELMEALEGIVDWHVRGTRFGIKVQENGLLACGEPGTQLTWMDAKVDGIPVTPRTGMPVEIEALWYNALRTMEDFSKQLGDVARSRQYGAMAAKAQAAFEPLFWNEDESCLYDVVDRDSRDASIRPNQILALSLMYPLLTGERARRVVERVEHDLLTPFGLRTLAPKDPRYAGRCDGSPAARDGAYHQGTVWPWLLGPFLMAYLRVHGSSPEAIQQALEWLAPLEEHLWDAGLGQISEIFDGDAPHRPRGCIAQAWSVGEILRVRAHVTKLSEA